MLHILQTLLYHNNHLFICLFVYLSTASTLVSRIRATRYLAENASETAGGSY